MPGIVSAQSLLSAVAAGGAGHDGGNGNGSDQLVDDLLHLGAERRPVGGLLDPGFGVTAAGAIGGDPLEEPAGTRQRQKYRPEPSPGRVGRGRGGGLE